MERIGRYEIVRELGRGAMGVVYLARDPRLDREVALKTYTLPEGVDEAQALEFRERFLREARAAAGLSHPGLVTIYDAGDDPERGIPYIAMELVPGESLKDRLAKGGRLESTWIVQFGAVLAEALHVAHKAGIVHRDIKPANILIRAADGAAKIADFGVARLKASDLTQSGAALGSPGYMSPEQVKGGTLDGRSDLFSLAVVLYEAFCGKRPFKGDDLVSLAYSIAHDTQVPLARQFPGCPPGLDRFFDRALSKDPGARFADGAAFRQAFLAAANTPSADEAMRTVIDAGTIPALSAATRPMGGAPVGAAVGARPAAPPVARPAAPNSAAANAAAPASSGRTHRRGLAWAGAGLAVIAGVAAAALFFLARPEPLTSADRGAAVLAPTTIAPDVPPPLHTESPAPRSEAELVDVKPVVTPAPAPERKAPPTRAPAPARATTPPPAPRTIDLTIAGGTEIHLAPAAPLSSATSHAGETFIATITEPVLAGDRVAIPTGSKVRCQVTAANPATKGLGDKAGSLSLACDRVETPDGSAAAMSASLTREGARSAAKTAGVIGGSAAGGALLGRLAGHSSKRAVAGALLGGAVGTGIAAGTRGEDVTIEAGTPLALPLERPLKITVHR